MVRKCTRQSCDGVSGTQDLMQSNILSFIEVALAQREARSLFVVNISRLASLQANKWRWAFFFQEDAPHVKFRLWSIQCTVIGHLGPSSKYSDLVLVCFCTVSIFPVAVKLQLIIFMNWSSKLWEREQPNALSSLCTHTHRVYLQKYAEYVLSCSIKFFSFRAGKPPPGLHLDVMKGDKLIEVTGSLKLFCFLLE